MQLDDFIQRIDAVIQALQAEMPAIADELALNAIALVKNRIVDQKKGIKGAKYSTKPMLATEEQFIVKSAFKQTLEESISKSGKKRKAKGVWIKFPKASKAVPVMKLPQGYKQFREIQGRQGEVVDASYSGKMWQGITIVARVQKNNIYTTVIGGGNTEAQNKLEWMVDKYGPFLTLFDDEQQLLNEVYNERVQGVINRIMK